MSWIFELPIELTLIAAVLLCFVIKKYRERLRVSRLIEKIPGPPCHWLLGHANLVLDLDRIKFPYGTYVLIYQMMASTPLIYGQDRICRMWLGFRPFVLLFTPEAVEVVLSSNNLTEKAAEYSFLKPWLGEGLVTSSKTKWKTRRKLLTPAFHFKILHDFLPIMTESTEILLGKLNRLTETKSGESAVVDILDYVTLCTLDVICETAMGIKVNCQEKESEYVSALHQVSELILVRISRPWLWPDFVFFNSKHGRRFNSCLGIMKNFTMNVIKKRRDEWIERNSQSTVNQDTVPDQNAVNQPMESNGNESKTYPGSDSSQEGCYGRKRMAFLDLLLEHHLKNNCLTIEDVREEVDTFMFAGHDTTAMSISWTLYILGLYKDIQDRVRDEIDSIVDIDQQGSPPDGGCHHKFTINQLKQMKYLDCVLKEVQRVYPIAPFIGRELTEDTMINGYLVPKGTTCAIFTYLLHRNEEVFPNPELFDPDRFSLGSSNGRHPFAYIPFSAGPRNCIGQKYAVIEQKIVVASIIRNFYVTSVDERDKLIISGEMVLRSRNGLRVILRKRSLENGSPSSCNNNDINVRPSSEEAFSRNI